VKSPVKDRQGRVLVLFPSQSYRVEAFLRAAERSFVDLWLGTDLPAAFTRHGRPVIGIDFRRPEEAARGIAEASAHAPFDGVIGTNESSAVVAALASERLGLPSSTVEGTLAARDKRRMRALLARAGVPSPAFQLLPRDRGIEAVLADVRFPCVVKPSMLTGSQGVIRADDAEALARAVGRVRAILDGHGSDAREDPGFFELLVEEYMPGREVAVEAIMTAGELAPLAIFDKPDELIGPFFEETLYVTPSRLMAEEQADILDVTARAARALGLTHGPIHAELRTHGGRSRIVELAGRSIGGLCSRVFQLVAGPLEDTLLAHAAGLPVPALGRPETDAPSRSPAAGVMMMPISRSGVLRRVTGLSEARAVPGVDDVTIAIQPGDAIRALPEGASYLGFIFAHGPTPEAVERSLRDAFTSIRFAWSPLLGVVP
jgi:biotin carboxylase